MVSLRASCFFDAHLLSVFLISLLLCCLCVVAAPPPRTVAPQGECAEPVDDVADLLTVGCVASSAAPRDGITFLEHVTVAVPELSAPSAFFVHVMGMTPDMTHRRIFSDAKVRAWFSMGVTHIHLRYVPDKPAQKIRGAVGLLYSDTAALARRLVELNIDEGAAANRAPPSHAEPKLLMEANRSDRPIPGLQVLQGTQFAWEDMSALATGGCADVDVLLQRGLSREVALEAAQHPCLSITGPNGNVFEVYQASVWPGVVNGAGEWLESKTNAVMTSVGATGSCYARLGPEANCEDPAQLPVVLPHGLAFLRTPVGNGDAPYIGEFFAQAFGADGYLLHGPSGRSRVQVVTSGTHQRLVFEEGAGGVAGRYDGYHVCFYVSSWMDSLLNATVDDALSDGYGSTDVKSTAQLVDQAMQEKQFRIQDVHQPRSCEHGLEYPAVPSRGPPDALDAANHTSNSCPLGPLLLTLEMEVRSLQHPLLHDVTVPRCFGSESTS